MNFSLNDAPLSKNLPLFNRRFPQLYTLLEETLKAFTTLPSEQTLGEGFELLQAKDGSWTARDNGIMLHSSYAPVREADRLIAAIPQKAGALVFFGCGLGHAVRAAAEQSDRAIIVIEPDPFRLFAALASADWEPVFSHEQLILCIGAATAQVIPLLERHGLDSIHLIRTPAWEHHAQGYFNDLDTLIARNRQKKSINDRTLESFSDLWFRNMCRNLPHLADCPGITGFEDTAGQLPACVLAAGPSLDRILPYLSEIKKRCILICVDTALRACLRQGVQPHFIVLGDPQYWNARHLDRLSAPESILITESAAYPAVFRFECLKIVLCSSMFPLGQYIEKRTGSKGKLGTGGSVASTAWDFARYAGCRTIFIAGLDLGFPGGRTHTAGSTFEEKAFTASRRISPAETQITSALFGAYPELRADYEGNQLRTDKRMSLYAWWFESRCAQFPEAHTVTITPEGLAIPGIQAGSTEQVLALPPVEDELAFWVEAGLKASQRETTEQSRNKLRAAVRELKESLTALLGTAEAALEACSTPCSTEGEYTAVMHILENYDKVIRRSEAAELASLLFPTEAVLNRKLEALPPEDSTSPFAGYRANIRTSGIIYSEIKRSAAAWLSRL